MLVIEECANSRAVTVFVRGSNKMVRSLSCSVVRAPAYTGVSRLLTKPSERYMTLFVLFEIWSLIIVSFMVEVLQKSVVQ